MQQQLQELLREVDGALRGQAVFEVLPPATPPVPVDMSGG